MEQPHLSTQLDYLEQKYLENQETIARLQQKTEGQAYELQEQGHRIEKLEAQMIAQQVEHRPPALAESNQAFASQLDSHTKALHELRREIEKTYRYEEQIRVARTEIERLNTAVSTFEAKLDPLKKQLEARDQAATYLEEQRQTDARRLAELQAELPAIQKKIETSLSKIDTVEQQIPQFSKYEFALAEVREEIRRHREHMDFQIAQRERLMKNWNDLAERQERRILEFEGLMEKYAEHHQLNKRALASLQDFQERLQREQHQALELQRLAEDRQRAEIEKWQGDYAQRWEKQVMEWKPQFSDIPKSIDGLKKQINEVAKSNQTIQSHIDVIVQIIEEDVHTRMMASQEWQRRFEEIANGQR